MAHLVISIHAPREGGDVQYHAVDLAIHDFNPRPPRGGRPLSDYTLQDPTGISIHAPREGGDLFGAVVNNKKDISIHAPREGGDSKDAQFYLRIFDKQVELLRFWGKTRGGCPRNPGKDRRFLGKSLANLPEISGHLDFAGGREGASRIPVRRTITAPGGVCQRIRGSSGR